MFFNLTKSTINDIKKYRLILIPKRKKPTVNSKLFNICDPDRKKVKLFRGL